MRATRWIWYTLSLVLVACVAALVVHGPVIIGKTAEPTPTAGDNVLDHLGVIDLDRLVRASADAKKLDQIDLEVAYVQHELDSAGPNPDELLKEARKRLEEERKKLEDQFKSDMDRMKADLDAKKASVEGTLKAEAEGIGAQMRAYEEELKKKAGVGPTAVSSDAGARHQLEEQMRRSGEPLRIAAQAKIAQRQLEIDQQNQAKMADAKRTLEARLADQMDGVLKADQTEKLQLQLDVKTASDEEQRKKLQDRLQAITDREDNKRDELRKRLSVDYDATRKGLLEKSRADLLAYQRKVQGEVLQKLHVQGGQVGSGPNPTVVKDLQHAMEARQQELKAHFEARKNALVGELKAASDVAQARLKDEQQQIVTKLKALQKRIYDDVVKAGGKISLEEQKRRDHLKVQLDELKSQRERVYDSIVAQIRDNVSKLAAEQKVPLVVGGYRVNIRCQDLTEMALKQNAGGAATGSAPGGH